MTEGYESKTPLALIATRIVEESLKPEARIDALSRLAQSDPAFAVRLLATVNSAAFGLRRRVGDVQQAVALLGLRGVRNLGLGLALSDMIPVGGESVVLMANCLRRAAAARRIALATRELDADEAFTLGLFLEVGLLARAREDLPGAVSLARRPAAARPVFEQLAGLRPHPELGREIAAHFSLPPAVGLAIASHHQPGPSEEPAGRIAWAAERVAGAFELGAAARTAEQALAALEQVGVSLPDAERILADLPAEVVRAAAVFERSVGPQPDLQELAADAQRSLVELNIEYESVVQRLQQLVAEKERLTQQLEEANARLTALAATDGLTGLPNKRAFEEGLTRDLARARRAATPIALVIADVDFFKRVNDTHGHQVGDEVLRAVAGALKGGLRAGDLPARYGGEEFVLLLPGTDGFGAAVVAERLRASVEATTIPIAPETELSVTASFGVASAARGDVTAKDLIARADAALYSAKRSGRNRVVSADADPKPELDARLGAA